MTLTPTQLKIYHNLRAVYGLKASRAYELAKTGSVVCKHKASHNAELCYLATQLWKR